MRTGSNAARIYPLTSVGNSSNHRRLQKTLILPRSFNMASSQEDTTVPSTPRTQNSDFSGNLHHRSKGYPRRRSWSPESPNGTMSTSGMSPTSPLFGRSAHGKFATDVPTNAQPTGEQYQKEFKYPNRTLQPHFMRKHGEGQKGLGITSCAD